jgi:hypothetical protein
MLQPTDEELRAWTRKDPATLSVDQLEAILHAERRGGIFRGELPAHLQIQREQALDSPSYLATEIIDPYYKDNFEEIHYRALDQVLAPYVRGERFELEGQEIDPQQFLGMVILFSRDTFKSSMMWLLLTWVFLWSKIRKKYDTRAMYVHQVLKKAEKRGENIRSVAKHNRKFRACFPEFEPPPGEWDTKMEWRWPNFEAHGAGEFSWTCYGETSDKTGGHYTIRIVDDWETEKSVTTANMLESSYDSFQMMDNLRDRTIDHCPYIIAGTHYHYQGVYKQLERNGGYLIWRVPAVQGSTKVLFDLAGLDLRDEVSRKKHESQIRVLERDRADDLNFPGRLNWRELVRSARSQGPRIFNCQMQLDPVPEDEQRFDVEALAESWVSEIPLPGQMWVYIRCDPAISEKREADDTAIVVGGVTWDGKRWLVDGWCGRQKRPSHIVMKTFNLARRWMAKGYEVRSIGFESVQYQEALAQMARQGVPEREAEYDGEQVRMVVKPCPIRSIKRSTQMHKQERLLEMDGPITRRELKIWKKCPIGQKAITQLTNFPLDKDDLLDALHDRLR